MKPIWHHAPEGSPATEDISVSFEFFPPKGPEMEKTLWSSIASLERVCPQFVSVTYGAGGTTRERTRDTVRRVLKETSLSAASHLTCVAASRDEVDTVAREFLNDGIRHIVALRGDPPNGVGSEYQPHANGYANAAELVGGLKQIADFEISVAAYPEKHPESADHETDLAMLAAKAENGATRAITQFFFDSSTYFRYLDRVRARGINIPIVPGILPVTNFARVAEFAGKCGAHIPASFARRFEGLENDPEAARLVAAAVAAEQVIELREQGVRQFHFYTLNRAELVYAISRLLGLGVPAERAAA